jgi:hypothetical protein
MADPHKKSIEELEEQYNEEECVVAVLLKGIWEKKERAVKVQQEVGERRKAEEAEHEQIAEESQ